MSNLFFGSTHPGTAPVLKVHQVGDGLPPRVDLLRQLYQCPEGGIRNARMRGYGLAITRACHARDDMCELKAIFDFVTHRNPQTGITNIRYTGDIRGKDTFQSALRTMEFGGGDCDDHAQLNAVLAAVNGFKGKWRITSNTGASWDHIYYLAGVPKNRPFQWIALDTTLGAGRFNKEPNRAKYQDFYVSEE